MYCDIHCTLLGLKSFLVSGFRVKKSFLSRSVSLLLHPSFSGWMERSFAIVKETVLCIALKAFMRHFLHAEKFPFNDDS